MIDMLIQYLRAVQLFLFSIVFLINSSSTYAETAQQIAKGAFPSVVLLVMEDANGQPVSLGSGFFVREGEIVTNLHVVEKASRGYAKVVGQTTKYNIEGTTGIAPDYDLVILKSSATGNMSMLLGNSDTVEVGEPVYAVGNPQGLEGTFSQGIVSSIRQVGSDKVLQITAPISPGSSGGPVLNTKGEVIGVSVATFSEGQNLNFAIPSHYIKDLLQKSGTVSPLTSIKSLEKQQSILFDSGEISSVAVVGQNFSYDAPWAWGEYSFSLVNKLREPVKNIYCLLVFYDMEGNPIDVDNNSYIGIITGGLAKRVTGKIDGSVEKLNNPTSGLPPDAPRIPKGKVEIRILDFQIVQ